MSRDTDVLMGSAETADADRLRMHWMALFLRLPERSAADLYPTVPSCNQRLAQVRWPAGPICIDCGSKEVGFLERRQIYYCRSCTYQCSVKAKTFLHRSHVDLLTWFLGAEEIIQRHAYGTEWSELTGHAVAEQLDISYVAAWRLKKALVKDLSQAGGGLIGKCLCTGHINKPMEISENTREHFFWLYNQLPQPMQS